MAQAETGRRSDILKTAYTLFGAQAYDKVSLAHIAQGAGISKSLLQHYYPQKIDIVSHMLTTLLTSAFAYVAQDADKAEDIMQTVSDFNRLFFKAVANNIKLHQFILSSVQQPDLLDVWIDTICQWLKNIYGEDTFSYLELKTALCFAMGGSMHLFQHQDELGIDYRFFTEVHMKMILDFLHYDGETIQSILTETKKRADRFDISAFLRYCDQRIDWFRL